MNKQKLKGLVMKIMRVIPYVLWGAVVVLCIANRKSFNVDTVLNYVPENYFVAALCLILIYALKGIAIFFPLIVLNIAGGMLFPPVTALIVNTVGVGIMTALPYYIGRFCGKPYIEKLERKYPQIVKFTQNKKDYFFQTFFLRIISCLPGDIVSIYFGAVNVPFKTYFVGSMLGIVPGIITATFMGTSILEPMSPMFIASVSITVLLSVISMAVHRVIKKNR